MNSQTDWDLLARLFSCSIGEFLGELERLGLSLASVDGERVQFHGCLRNLTPEHVMVLRRRTHEIRNQHVDRPRPSEEA